MPRHRLKNFSDLAFIQSIDKPRHLAPLVAAHKDFFERQKIDVTRLTNDDSCDRKLLAAFTQPAEDIPPELLEVLYVLDDLADEDGHDRLIHEAERQGIDLNGSGHESNPADFALSLHRTHPELVRICHEKTLHQKIKNYEEYQSRDNRRLNLKTAKAQRAALEAEMAPWFESKNRSRACEVYVYEEKEELKFQITHGRPYRTEGSINKTLQRTRVAYRPQQHDSVVYDTRTGILKINAPTSTEKNLYREAFGKILFGDLNFFPSGQLYTLAPLRKGKVAIATVDGVESVRLSEVWIQLDDSQRFLQISKAHDLIQALTQHGKPNLEEGQLVRASFMLKYSSGGRARKLELRPPNVAIYDRDRDGEAAEEFLMVNGFLKRRHGDES